MKTTSDARPVFASHRLRIAASDALPALIAIDDDACGLFDDVGLGLCLPAGHNAFAQSEHDRWAEAADAGRVYVALHGQDAVGFAVLGFVDGEPHLAQMSVRRAYMRRGVGTALLARAIEWSAPHGALWLTTYDHVAWNRPYYERFGFVVVDCGTCGPELRAVLARERQVLPASDHRTAMVFRHHRCLQV